MAYVQKLVTEDSFDDRGVLVKAGHIAVYDEAKLNGDERHIHDVGDFTPAVVEVSALAPTGPNPKIPQQIPPDAIQGPGGDYVQPGKRLVAEVTDPVDKRIEDAGLRDTDHEDEVNDKLAELMGTSPAAPAAPSNKGTVAEVTADLGTKTDAELKQLLADENASEKPRTGVVSAVEAELKAREEEAKAPGA